MPKKKEYLDYDDEELLYLISDNNDETKEIICKKYKPVISFYANKYSIYVEGKGIDYNDLYQEGLIGLLNAINNFKEQKDIKFSTFAFLCIKRKILTAVKNANRKKHSILNESYSLDYKQDDDIRSFDNTLSTTYGGLEDVLVGKEDSEYFNRRLNDDLTDFERMVYDLRINDFTYEEIAQTLGKTQKSIERTLDRIRIKIKDILNKIN